MAGDQPAPMPKQIPDQPVEEPPPQQQRRILRVGPNNVLLQDGTGPLPMFGQLIGSLLPYDPTGNLSFSGWLQRLDNYCVMNGIHPEPVDQRGQVVQILQNARRMLFIQYIGDRAFEEIRRTVRPYQPHQRSIPVICDIVRQAFEPPRLVKATRMKFSSLVQRDGQSAQSFCNALQVAAENCDFGAAYSMNLKNRLIAGVRCDRIRETLLIQAKTFDYTGALFLSLNAARQQSLALARAAHINVARQPAK